MITISHCYNGINGASTGDCGVTNAHPAEGSYDITFDFIVADRFIQGHLNLGRQETARL